MNIRPATSADAQTVKDLYLDAFPDSERETVAGLAAELLSEPTALPFLAVTGDTSLGFICFSPMTGKHAPIIYTLTPLAVATKSQRMGIGSKLIRHGAKTLTAQGAQVLAVYGDPKYYGRFGFNAEIGELFLPKHKMQFPFGWQGLYLSDTKTPKAPFVLECVNALNKPDLW